MNTLVKKTLYLSFILFGLFNQNLYAADFTCDFLRHALVWEVGELEATETDGELILMRTSPVKLMADACHLHNTGQFSVTMNMAIPRINQSVYKLPNGLELINMSVTWTADTIHWIGTKAHTVWELYPDVESKNYWARDETSTFRAVIRGTLTYHNSAGRVKDGPFNIKIGEINLEFGPIIPIYLHGSLQVEHICSIITMNTLVNMPIVHTKAFHGINQPAGAKVPVEVDMNCSRDMPDISVRLNSAYTLNSQQGILLPDPTSTAKGMAIQLLDKQGNPIDLSKNLKSITTNGRFHRIAMQAQYIQTGKTIKAGILKSSVSFDVFYQ